MHGYDGVVPVIFAVEQCAQTKVFEALFQRLETFLSLLRHFFVVLLFGHLHHDFQVFQLASQFVKLLKPVVDGFLLFHELLG